MMKTKFQHLLPFLLTFCLIGCGGGSVPKLNEQIRKQLAEIAIKTKDIEHLEASSQAQIHSAKKAIDALLAQKAPSVAELGNAYGKMGMLLHAYLLKRAADPCYRNAMFLAPQEPRWPYLLGHVYRKSDDPASAIEFFQRALSMIDDPLTLSGQRLAAQYWLGQLHLSLGDLPEAKKGFEQIQASEPNSPLGPYGLGRTLLKASKPREAAAAFEIAAQSLPDSPTIHYQLMLAYRQADDDERAQIHQRKFQSRGPELQIVDPWFEQMELAADTARVYRMRGDDARERGDYERAVVLLRKSLERDPKAAPVHLNLGMALIRTGKTEEAKREFRIVIKLQPKNSVAYLNLGSIFAATKSYKQAESYLRDAITHQPKDKRALLLLAGVYRRLNRLTEAIELYRRVLEDDPGNDRALVGFSTLLMRVGKYKEARKWLGKTHQVLRANQIVIHLLSRLLSACPDDAIRDGKTSLKLANEAAEQQAPTMYAETKAMALAELGQFTEAMDWQNRAIEQTKLARRDAKVAILKAILKEYQARRPWRLQASKSQ